MKVLTYLSLEFEYAEGGLEALARRLRRHNKVGKVPNADTFLYRLKKMRRSEALTMLHGLKEEVLSAARRKGAFRRRATPPSCWWREAADTSLRAASSTSSS